MSRERFMLYLILASLAMYFQIVDFVLMFCIDLGRQNAIIQISSTPITILN